MSDVKQQETKPEFATSDFYLAAFLMAKGHAYLAAEDADDRGDRVVFILAGVPTDELLASFTAGRADVNARKFVNAIRGLKSTLYRRRKNT